MPTEPFTREQQIDENSRAVAETRRQLTDHRHDIDDNTQQILHQNEEIRENRNCLEEQKRNIDYNTRHITEQGREIEGAKYITKNNTMAIEEIKKTHPVTLDNRKEFDELKHKVDDLAQQRAPCAFDTLKELKTKVTFLEQKHKTDYKRQIEVIQSRVNDLEQQDARGYKKLLVGLHNRVTALEQKEDGEYRRKIEELQNRVKALEQQQTSNSELQNRVIALEQQQTGNIDIQKLQEKMTALEQEVTFTKGYKESVDDLQNRIVSLEHKQTDLDCYPQKNIGEDPSGTGNSGVGVDESFVANSSDSNYDEVEELQAGVAIEVKEDTRESKTTTQKSTWDNRNSVRNTLNQVIVHDQEKKKGKQKDFDEYNQRDFNQDISEITNKYSIECKMEKLGLRSLAAGGELVEKQDIEDIKSDLNGTHINSTSVYFRETEECHSKDKNSGQYCDGNENTGGLTGKFKVYDIQEDESRDTCNTVAQKDKNSNICENAEHQPGRRHVELENKIKILEMQVEELKNRVKVLEQKSDKSKDYTDLQDKNSLPDVTGGSKKYMKEGKDLEAVFEQSNGEAHSSISETGRRRALE